MDSQNKSSLPHLDAIIFSVVCSAIIISVLNFCLNSKRSPLRRYYHRRNTTIVSLPEEIIEEILSRLPVKSLLKFRCVSKPWRYLISSKRFINKQLQDSKHQRALFCSIKGEVLHCSLPSLFDKPDTQESNFETSFLSLVGCCNGLVCILLNGNQFVLWNPSTRISKKLPHLRVTPREYIRNYGFGCDESSGDYKVVVIFSDERPTICKIYSFKTDSWKEITNAFDECDRMFFYPRGMLVSGKLHWVMVEKWEIVGFDLKREVFEKVEQPLKLSGCCSYQYLGILGECLSLIRRCTGCRFEVWVMKEYGVKESWEKLMVAMDENYSPPWTSPSYSAFCIQPEGEIFLVIVGGLIIYDRKIRKFINAFRTHHQDHIYVESLLSPSTK